MFSAFKSAIYFTKANLAAMDAFGIDLRMLDRVFEGKVVEACNLARQDKRSPEEGVVLCLALITNAYAEAGRFPPEGRPDYFKLARHAAIVDGWTAQGKISLEARDAFVEATEKSIAAVEDAGMHARTTESGSAQ